MMLWSSCREDLANLNIDPNTSPSANPKEVLTSGIAFYAVGLDGFLNENNSLYAQYWAGGPGVALLDHERYFIEPGDYNTEWAYTYNQALSDLDFVIDNGDVTRSAIAQLLSCYIYQNTVDLFGNIPYSEALNGAIADGSILTPKYDDAKAVYADLITRVEAATAKLKNADDVGLEDVIYGGSAAKWFKFGNSLLLKLLMRQSVVDASVSTKVKSLIASGSFIESASDIAAVPFPGGGNLNPMYARRESGIGMFYVLSNSFKKVMDDRNDPRLAKLYKNATGPGRIVGMDQGNVANLVAPAKSDYSYPNTVSYGSTNAVIFMSHWEVSFLRAEAAARFGTADDDQVMFNKAVTDHFAFIGATGASTYLSSDVVYSKTATLTVKLNLIGVQKYISMNGLQETEGYIEAKRFDTPDSRIFTAVGSGIYKKPTRSVIGDAFPSLRLYPQSELSFNPNSPKDRKITDKVFWDN